MILFLMLNETDRNDLALEILSYNFSALPRLNIPHIGESSSVFA